MDIALALAEDGKAYVASENRVSMWSMKAEMRIASFDVTDPALWAREAPPSTSCALM